MTKREHNERVSAPLLALVVALLLPLAAFAQSGDLRATIRTELLKDPRAAQLSQAQLDAMINVLAQGANEQGITSHDITWQPSEPAPAAGQTTQGAEAFCMGLPDFFCAVSSGFGFDDSNTVIPIALLMSSGLLLFLLYELKHHHRHDAAMAAASSTSALR